MNPPRIIISYLARAFGFGLVISLLVLSFIMSLGVIFQITDLIAKGAQLSSVIHIFLNGIPAAMMFAIPMSTLVAALLLFGRLSADGEITAMRVSGLNLGQIMLGPLLISGLATLFCFYVNCFLAPTCHLKQRSTIRSLATQAPMDLLEVGRYIQEYPGFSMYITSKSEDVLHQVRIFTQTPAGKRREILAEEGRVHVADNKVDLLIDLKDVTLDPFSDDIDQKGYCKTYPFIIKNALKKRPYRIKPADLTIVQLWDKIQKNASTYEQDPTKENLIEHTRIKLELHKRLVLTLSSFSFAFLGIPLGIRSHRKESSIGVAMSLVLVLNFYLFIMIAESLAKMPHVQPQIIMWMPVAISLAVGSWLIRRAS